MRAVGAASTPGLHWACGLEGRWRWGKGVDTWPPEKPTATTPSSSAFVRNLGGMVDGEVMVGEFVVVLGRK